MADIIFVFTGQGFGPAAQMITEGPFPYFAQLRWGTLESLSGCGLHVLILSSIVQPAVMHRQTLVQLVRQSFANPRFTHQLAFVTWLSAWLRALQRCERVMLLQMRRNTVMKHLSIAMGKATCCTLLGVYAEGVVDACVREAEAWDAAQFGNNLWFLAHGLALCEWLEPSRRIRSGYCRGVACFSARMGEADVKEEVMR